MQKKKIPPLNPQKKKKVGIYLYYIRIKKESPPIFPNFLKVFFSILV